MNYLFCVQSNILEAINFGLIHKLGKIFRRIYFHKIVSVTDYAAYLCIASTMLLGQMGWNSEDAKKTKKKFST